MALGKKNNTPAGQAPQSSASKYAGLATTQTTQRGNYLGEGVHALLRVDAFRKSNGFRAGPMFVGNLTVIHLYPDSATVNPVGQEVSEVLKESNIAFMARMRAFLDAAGGLTQDDWNTEGGEKIVAEASGDGQPLANAVVEVRTVKVIKQNALNKPQSELQPSDTYTRVDYLRRVPFSEVAEVVENAEQFFPDLAALIAEENAD